MKLLTHIANLDELTRLKALFASKGVLIHVANENTARNFGTISAIADYTLFVVLEEQYTDAELLLENENHSVLNTVDIEAYEELVEQHKPAILSHMLQYALIGGIAILVVIYTIVWLLYR